MYAENVIYNILFDISVAQEFVTFAFDVLVMKMKPRAMTDIVCGVCISLYVCLSVSLAGLGVCVCICVSVHVSVYHVCVSVGFVYLWMCKCEPVTYPDGRLPREPPGGIYGSPPHPSH